MSGTVSYRARFDDSARLDEAMNQALRTFIEQRVKGYHEGMRVKDYVLYDNGQPLSQSQSAGLISPLRQEVNRVALRRLRKAAGLDENGLSLE